MRTRSVAAAFAAAAVAVLTATPAVAAPPVTVKRAALELDLPNFKAVAAGSTAKPLDILLRNAGDEAATSVTVKIDASRLPGTVTASLPAGEGCTVTGKVATCSLATLAAEGERTFRVGLKAAADLPEDFEGELTVTATAVNSLVFHATSTVVVVPAGSDLGIAPIKDVALEPGASTDVPLVIGNTGNAAADLVYVRVATMDHLTQPDRWSNCSYRAEDAELICAFDVSIPAGATYRLDPATPLTVTVGKGAPGPAKYAVFVGVLSAADLGGGEGLPSPGGDKPARLVPVEKKADLDIEDNFVEFEIEVGRTLADARAIGTKIDGAVGDTRKVLAAIRNDGPSAQLDPDGEWGSVAVVKFPAGVRVLRLEDACLPLLGDEPDWDSPGKPTGSVYVCFPDDTLAAGEKFEFPFEVKIEGAGGEPGFVSVDGGVQDPDPSNNRAEITLTGTGGAGGGLPVTGAPAMAVAGGGVALLAAGVAAFLISRRRRIVTVVE